MKKLFIAIAGLLMFAPIVANAASASSGTDPKTTVSCTPDEMALAGDTQTCTVSISTTQQIKTVKATIVPKDLTYTNVKISRVTAAAGWTGTAAVQGEDGKVDLTTATAKTGTFTVFTYTAEVKEGFDPAKQCGTQVKAIIGTETEEFPEVPVDTPEPKTPQNPDTGAFAPYLLIGAGVIVAVGVYFVARRKNKFYKI